MLGICTVLVVLMSVFVYYMVKRQQSFLKQQNLVQARNLAHDLSMNASTYVVTNEFAMLDKLLQSYKPYPNLRYAMVLSANGRVMSHTDNKLVGLTPNDDVSRSLKSEPQVQTLVENNDVLDIAAPVMSDGEIVGWVRVGFEQRYILQNLDAIQRNGILYILFALGVGVIVSLLIANRLIRELSALVSTVEKIRTGKQNVRASGSRTMEINNLAQTFNQMLDEISANEHLLEMMMENMPVGVFTLDEKGIIVSANNAARELWNGAEYVGIENFEVYKAWFVDSGKRVQAHEWGGAVAIERGEKTLNQEIEVEAFDGSRKFVLNSAIPLRDEHERIIGAVVINVDITERKKLAHQVQERMKELRTIYRTSKILQNETDNLNTLLQKIVDILPAGWQYPEVCAAKIEFDNKVFTSPNYQASDVKQVAEIITEDGKTGFISVIYTAEKPAEAEGPFLKEERDLIDTLAELFEVQYNKRVAYNALVRSEANLLAVFENTDVGHLLLDRNLNVVAFNRRFQTGYEKSLQTPLEVEQNYLQRLAPESRESVSQHYAEVFRTKQPIEYDTKLDIDGVEKYLTINVAPVLNRGRVDGLCVSVSDITRRKLLELEREKMIADLMQRNTDLEQFAYIVSHNLRTPVANIIGLAGLLDDALPEATRKQYLSSLGASVKRLDDVIKDLNEILQVRRQVNENKVQVDFNALVTNIKTSISQLLERTNTEIQTDFADATGMLTISSYINSIFYNFISNSIKYAHPSRTPKIKISSATEDSRVVLRFADNGAGIDMEKHGKHVFGLYKRFDVAKEGKGIGLFMTKTQVETLGGKINVESKPGVGTEFIVTL